ncbi:hypothetical protein [Aquamicrobium sp.]|uniref:hypothetical protein n=1 Tax=Aquamicrobium sp. TaxID=1872579 RepID=UPI002582C17E|nr:hypothetical protein [Aquamicrobium sp.]MCK9551223.1 hypothetical protein [Aquamicrobium sp.]
MTGESVNHGTQISERDVAAVKNESHSETKHGQNIEIIPSGQFVRRAGHGATLENPQVAKLATPWRELTRPNRACEKAQAWKSQLWEGWYEFRPMRPTNHLKDGAPCTTQVRTIFLQ